RQWSRVSDDINGIHLEDMTNPDADYFIGANPPEVSA
ncbi:MAG: hypothetical protein RLZZ182_1831, partial [Pseudomonadota bacterium]